MKLLHALATKTNEIPLGPAKFSTVHEKPASGAVVHAGFQITAGYAGDNVKSAKHAYSLRFNVEEARAIHEGLALALKRFEVEGMPEHTLVTDVSTIDTEED